MRGNPPGRLPARLLFMRHIIAGALRLLVGMGRRHAPAQPVMEQADEQAGVFSTAAVPAAHGVAGKPGLHRLPSSHRHDRMLLPGLGPTTVDGTPEIARGPEKMIEAGAGGRGYATVRGPGADLHGRRS